MSSVASHDCGFTVSTVLDHLKLSDFGVFDWIQSSPADSERTRAVCTIIGSGIAKIDNGQVQLEEKAMTSSCHMASGQSSYWHQICFCKEHVVHILFWCSFHATDSPVRRHF